MYLPRSGAKAQEIKLYSAYPSQRFTYVGSKSLQFFHEGKALAAGQLPQRKLVATAEIPEKTQEVFIVLFPAGDGVEGALFEAMVFNMDQQSFPAGKMLVLNASGMEFAGKFNDTLMEVKQGVVGIFNARAAVKIDLRKFVRRENKDGTITEKWLPAFSGEEGGGGDKQILLLLPPFYKDSVAVRSKLFHFAEDSSDQRGNQGR